MNDDTIRKPSTSDGVRGDLDDWIFQEENWLVSDR